MPSANSVAARRCAVHSSALFSIQGAALVGRACVPPGQGHGSCYPQGQCKTKGSHCWGWEGTSPPISAVVRSHSQFKLNFTSTTSVCICFPRFRCRQAVTLKLSFSLHFYLKKYITKMWRMDVLACLGNLTLGIHGFSFLPFQF